MFPIPSPLHRSKSETASATTKGLDYLCTRPKSCAATQGYFQRQTGSTGTPSSHSPLPYPPYFHPVSSVDSNPTSSCLESALHCYHYKTVLSHFLCAIAAALLSPPLSPSSLPLFLFLTFSVHSRVFSLYERGWAGVPSSFH